MSSYFFLDLYVLNLNFDLLLNNGFMIYDTLYHDLFLLSGENFSQLKIQ